MSPDPESRQTVDDGGPAFPTATQSPYDSIEPGMTLRDHFAGLAMQAAATNPTGADGFTFSERAKWAYEQADAMIRARKAGSPA